MVKLGAVDQVMKAFRGRTVSFTEARGKETVVSLGETCTFAKLFQAASKWLQ
jgi:hypothetical protein